ncbi:PIG-L family deacetylase [Rhodovastum atsumiense]|uniref:PIG-L family deacetylase n=1 Tax=Rhodovastum atsumiense TaxID=504468 RepID=A0A5M6IVK6_9PROT|nr:PIG-L deacetylase family protein [Rhodovastum atsumiense]KAA5611959.1 PIG-L family deacetylase [Rhodovastum atsumiense]CAH2598735.1 PIG-L family deacetylase [Rhodovastum atsumiense]
MRGLALARPGESLSVLCLGAHADDIEIGAGGTILGWIAAGVQLDVHWCVLSAVGPREAEAMASAEAFLAGARSRRIELGQFRDGYFPNQGGDIKDWVQDLAARARPDVILTHRADDAHQDHRELRRLTWNAFRNHLILEYEIPKWDGDLGRPNVYMPISMDTLERKLALLQTSFATQRAKDWFDPETFRGLARLRGMECRAPERYAEAFVVSKAILQ